jgi:hypothetical protein
MVSPSPAHAPQVPAARPNKVGWLGEFYGVPLVMVTGDAALAREVEHFFPGIETVTVKTARSRGLAASLSREEASRRIEEAAFRAVGRRHERQPYVVPSPVALEIVLATVPQADRAALLPRSQRVSERRLRYVADDYPEPVKAFNAALRLPAPGPQAQVATMARTDDLLKRLEQLEEARRAREEWQAAVTERWIQDVPPFDDPVADW